MERKRKRKPGQSRFSDGCSLAIGKLRGGSLKGIGLGTLSADDQRLLKCKQQV